MKNAVAGDAEATPKRMDHLLPGAGDLSPIWQAFSGVRKHATHGRIGARLLLLLVCPKDPLGNTSGLQDSACSLFYLAVGNFAERDFAERNLVGET
jgi:hypothetical protein